ncbi:MAG TPA: alpha/beta fold hydrolase [Thermoanaerobaculia bacterium]|nr:alpha/beta fold hydrolase [Thermoanaerobaculia bacterium]
MSLHSGIFLRVAESSGAIADVWFVHGFGESGLSFQEAFSSPLVSAHNLYAPDLPGSGVTPPIPDVRSIASAGNVLASLLTDLSGARPIVLVGHSLGSLIAVEAARLLGDRMLLLVSVEGNLTDDDTYLIRFTKFDTPETFYATLTRYIPNLDEDKEALLRYSASLRLADPETLWHLGRSGLAATGDTLGAESFLATTCRKAYYWGGTSLSEKSRKLLAGWPILKQEFVDAGHWPMITRTRQFYATLADDISAACKG